MKWGTVTPEQDDWKEQRNLTAYDGDHVVARWGCKVAKMAAGQDRAQKGQQNALQCTTMGEKKKLQYFSHHVKMKP